MESYFIINKKMYKNTITDVGKEEMCKRIGSSSSSSPFIYLAIGSGTNPALTTDTTLQTELARGSSDYEYFTSGFLESRVFEPGQGTGTINEIGLFNSSSQGVMLSRCIVDSYNKTSTKPLLVEWRCYL